MGTMIEEGKEDPLLLGEKWGEKQSESFVNMNKEDGWSGASQSRGSYSLMGFGKFCSWIIVACKR